MKHGPFSLRPVAVEWEDSVSSTSVIKKEVLMASPTNTPTSLLSKKIGCGSIGDVRKKAGRKKWKENYWTMDLMTGPHICQNW